MPVGSGPRRWTYEDLQRLPEDGKRHEIIDGEHFVMSAPGFRHQAVLGRLFLAIGNHLAARPSLGQALLGPFDIVFTLFDVVEPDLLFIAADQRGILNDKNASGAPALVVEILSTSIRRHDERTKRQLYERGGVREYWIIDPDRESVAVHRRTDGGALSRVANVARQDGTKLTTPLLPDLSVSLDDLFASTQ
jgi:Uma2 family endonuclease